MCAVILFSALAKLKDGSMVMKTGGYEQPGNLSARVMDHSTHCMRKLPLLLTNPRSDLVVRSVCGPEGTGSSSVCVKGTIH